MIIAEVHDDSESQMLEKLQSKGWTLKDEMPKHGIRQAVLCKGPCINYCEGTNVG